MKNTIKQYFKLLSYSLLFIVLGVSCQQNTEPQIAFYHWKANAEHSAEVDAAMKQSASDRVYLHYFDIDVAKSSPTEGDKFEPVYLINKVDSAYQNYNIIPVIFIVNQVIRELKNEDVQTLSERITQLVNEISTHHFNAPIKHLQIDCDWTAATRHQYFALLELLKQHFDVSVTIRLHQVKYPDRTGVPPVKSGALMLYNMGDLRNFTENSILESNIVADYINTNSTYPLQLDLALPLFSQTVLKSNSGKINLVKDCNRTLFESQKQQFKQLSKHVFEVQKDTLFSGFYLRKGNQIKLEESTEAEIIKSYQIIKSSQLPVNEIIFYHLDSTTLSNINFKSILQQL
ncbi:hypothetical protein [Saccharicrinis aurantiacus]|uniref:hypothetical protein n=1 Tax=Saccharicrinis aurantiacus TaxID=1849719 RepID=UPI0008381093|nr:hypothetical protein [Saccharicrinis aurantiacus]